MGNCCTPKGYRWVFSEGRARADAKRYRRRGLDRTSKRIAELLKRDGVKGRTLLEVGGGVGAIQIDLLRAGVTRAVSIELTPTYEEAAGLLLRDAGLADRVERRVLDFAAVGGDVAPADIVIMNRVICCYPDRPRLAGAAADHARDVLVLSFPKQSWWTRIGLQLGNVALRLARREFRIFLHSPDQILAAVERHGLTTTSNRRGLFWQVATLRRSRAVPGDAVP